MAVTAPGSLQFAADHPLVTCVVILASLYLLIARSGQDEPPSLPEVLPFVSNTYQYMTDLPTLMGRASRAMIRSDVVKFWLGPMRVYLVKGGESVQAIFRSSSTFRYEKFILMVVKNLQGSSKEDVEKLLKDKSSRNKTPAPGWENMPQEQRYWYQLHHLTVDNLSRTESTSHLANMFTKFFGDSLEKQPLGEWATVRLFDFLRKDMAESALKSLCGTRILELVPDYIDQFWRFDSIGVQAVYGLPKWINPKPVEERDKLNRMTQKFMKDAFSTFDWEGHDVDSHWEPTFGSRYFRINANTIPVTAWALMEALQDPKLFEEVREEALQTVIKDPATGERSFDTAKLLSMPLMQSIYVECMRLHVSIAITREVVEPTKLQGYRLEKGSMIQALTNLMHLDEQIWSQEGHPASEFWAERHIQQVAKVDEATGVRTTERQFVMGAKPSEFFPYGGGISICPGRFFAKQEILLTIAMLVTRFEIEFVEWTCKDGSKSDRPPIDDKHYFGSAAVPPDRDAKVRWRRLW
ncbi:cholesterol 7-alpha-monooxygenase [Colletotrichum spaethianum]|uniref:Cholesterol 7-alpha-monooxygenase n=1 Tax=Colletotrichum spaethianum TaxID=700344 RepID=A0AA37P0Y2_9PEZI|nr:cholesterol 7-alpha-monooxygenase [Colletotrichum spaethianum]GKT46130.1 cholesterol 7-alpha-monooxygenase [Colletotrichum spaethianum]